MVLSQNKSSVIDRALMVDEVLAREVFVSHLSAELAGRFAITATAAPGVDLTRLEDRIRGLIDALGRTGIDPASLERMKTRQEADFVRSLETVSARTAELALSNTLTGDPARFLDEQQRLSEVGPEDVNLALLRYLAGRPAVVLSVVPEGHPELAAQPRGNPPVAPRHEAPDRSQRPPVGPAPAFATPAVWRSAAGPLELTGVELRGSGFVTLRLALPGGRGLERPGQYGLSTLLAELLGEGTEELSTTELTEALDALGASLWIRASDDELSFTMTALDRQVRPAAELLARVVHAPRLARGDFERLKTLRLASIAAREDRIGVIASDAWRRLMRGDGPLGAPALGRRESIESLTRDDVARHHERAVLGGSPRMSLVGALDAEAARAVFEPLTRAWGGSPRGTHPPGGPQLAPTLPAEPGVYFVHKAGAAQSELRVGHPSVSSLDPEWYPLQVLNFILGGNFNSRINLNLREDKGYTYGARSGFEGGLRPGSFLASAAVQTEVTAPALVELAGELERILEGVTEAELAFARDALTQALLRQFEGSAPRLVLADRIARYGWPVDYPARRLAVLDGLTPDGLTELARRHIDPGALRLLVVGDRSEVLAGLEALGRGPVTELDTYGAPLP